MTEPKASPEVEREMHQPGGRSQLGRPFRGRVDGPDKVTGRARYAYEHQVPAAAYAWPVTASIAKGTVRTLDAAAALEIPGVLTVLTPENARDCPAGTTRSSCCSSHVQSPTGDRSWRRWWQDSLEAARAGASEVRVEYEPAAHDVTLTADHPELYKPDHVNPNYATDSLVGDFASAFADAAVRVDAVYRTQAEHNNPMEPHATIAWWSDGGDTASGGESLTMYDSIQGPSRAAEQIAALFGLAPDRVRVIAEHVGGGFGAKGTPRPNAVLAAMAARVAGRPVKCALTRQQMFAVSGHRAPSIQRVRLGAYPTGG